jgi:CheY-like chemotaxis protein
MNGFQVARAVRSRVRLPPVILITAYPGWKVYDEAEGAGVSDVLIKPLKLFDLVERVRLASGPH